jgi:hypothetical protein
MQSFLHNAHCLPCYNLCIGLGLMKMHGQSDPRYRVIWNGFSTFLSGTNFVSIAICYESPAGFRHH